MSGFVENIQELLLYDIYITIHPQQQYNRLIKLWIPYPVDR